MSEKQSVSIRLSTKLNQKVVSDAKSLGISRTEVIEQILNGYYDNESVPIVQNGSLDEIKTLIENNAALKDIKELKNISNLLLQKNREIFNKIEIPKVEGTIQLDNPLYQKLLGIHHIMKEEDVRYEKDDEIFIAKPETVDEVLDIIIHNYHSLIVNSVI